MDTPPPADMSERPCHQFSRDQYHMGARCCLMLSQIVEETAGFSSSHGQSHGASSSTGDEAAFQLRCQNDPIYLSRLWTHAGCGQSMCCRPLITTNTYFNFFEGCFRLPTLDHAGSQANHLSNILGRLMDTNSYSAEENSRYHGGNNRVAGRSVHTVNNRWIIFTISALDSSSISEFP